MFTKRSKEMDIAERETGAKWKVIHDQTAMSLPGPIRSVLPSDFHIFGPFKKHLAGKRFAAHANAKQAITDT